MAAALIPGAPVKDCARFAVDAAGFHKMNRINTQPRRLLCQSLQLRRHSLPRCAGIQLDVDGNDVSVFERVKRLTPFPHVRVAVMIFSKTCSAIDMQISRCPEAQSLANREPRNFQFAFKLTLKPALIIEHGAWLTNMSVKIVDNQFGCIVAFG